MSNHMQKPKRKSDQSESPLNSILVYLGLRPTPIDFTVSASLETCMARLKEKTQTQEYFGYLLNRASIEVDFYQIDNERCRFRVTKKHYKASSIEMTGSLEQVSDINTRITGSTETVGFLTPITLPIMIIILVVFIIFGFLMVNSFPYIIFFELIVMAGLAGITIGVVDDRNRFINFVQQTVTYSENAKPTPKKKVR